jgi:serine/threonine-protein kinase
MVALIAATVAVVAIAGGVLLARVIVIDGTDPVVVAVTSSLAVSESSSISPSPTPSPTPTPTPTTTTPPPPPPEPTPTTVTVTSVLPAPNNDTLPATGDLGLSEVIKNIGCSRKYVTFLGSSVDPSLYRAEISSFLANNPGSSYLMTESSCGSLTPRVDGNSVYAVYLGPFSTATEACDARRTPENYVKVLDGSDPDESAIEC